MENGYSKIHLVVPVDFCELYAFLCLAALLDYVPLSLCLGQVFHHVDKSPSIAHFSYNDHNVHVLNAIT
jgi:hypothetical protein